jgi:hypothetical protein
VNPRVAVTGGSGVEKCPAIASKRASAGSVVVGVPSAASSVTATQPSASGVCAPVQQANAPYTEPGASALDTIFARAGASRLPQDFVPI